MPGQAISKSFKRQVFITRDDLLAARWWHEEMAASAVSPSRRSALRFLVGMGGLVGMGVLLRAGCHALSDPGISMDALELQRKEGWAVGSSANLLSIRNAVSVNSQGQTTWAAMLPSLGRDLAPRDMRLDPYAVSTLFDVVGNPRGAGLATLLRPMHSPAMDVAAHAAEGLAALFSDETDRRLTALILDMPGPESVAAASGVARWFAPVFLFDNWPHPLGVVPSHETLAAAMYYQPDFIAARESRAAPGSPAFVLDSNRLSPYRDESDRFDNRYLARLPGADKLRAMGIERVLYVTATEARHELDDLNDDFVALKNSSIDIKMIALSDFAPASERLLLANQQPITERRYYYGGHPHGHLWFWSSYHWQSPAMVGQTWHGSLPRSVSSGPAFVPSTRPTMFSSRTVGGLSGVGRQKPSGFGRVSYRSGGGGSFRSGSFGRTSFGGFG